MNCIILYNNIWYNHIIKYIFYYYTVLTNNKFITSHNEHISVHKPHKLTTKQDECDKDNENQKKSSKNFILKYELSNHYSSSPSCRWIIKAGDLCEDL